MGGKKTVENSRRFEKDRRDKLNVAFGELCKLLPDHDPSITLSKMEILRKAAEYIKHLQLQNDEIMKLGEDSALKNESEKLKKRVANLLFKTKELVDALRSAGVPIPTSKRKKKKSKNVVGDNTPINQNTISDGIEKDAKSSKVEATTIKKVKCGCMKQTPEKKPLKESNLTVTTTSTIPTIVSVGNVIAVTSVSSNSIPPWTNHTKLLTVTPNSLIRSSVMTSRVQNIPVVKKILPSCKNLNTNTTISMAPKSNICNKNLPVARSGINGLPITASTIQTIPIIGNNLLPTKIVKEVTPTLINKKTVSIVTTTSSSSLTTQTIVNSTHLISLSQSNIVSSPVVPPSVQTVPVLEKNILSNLGPGTLILADGRIMNVPPLVPQILLKPQSTVILMPGSKKKEKIIVPKKRDVTKTTFANKAPIPAIKSFKLESCPKVRPKKRPKAVLKKAETTKIPEKGSDPGQGNKKRKFDTACYSNTEDRNVEMSTNMDSSKQVENKDIDSMLVDEIGKDIASNEEDNLSNLTSREVLNEEIQVGSASDVPETSSTIDSLGLINNCSPSPATSSSILAVTDSPPSTVTMSNPNPDITKLCDSIVVSLASTETFDSLANTSIPPALSDINESNTKLTFKDVNLIKITGDEKNSSFESNNDVITRSEVELSSFNTDSSQVMLGIASTEENVKTSLANTTSVDSFPPGPQAVCEQSDHKASLEIETISPKNDLANSESLTHGSTLTTSCSETNSAYSVSLIATSSLPDTTQSSLFGTSNEKSIGNKSVTPYSCQPQQMFYTSIDFNQENRSESDSFQQEERLNSRLSEKCEVQPATKPPNDIVESKVNTYTGNSSQAENQLSKIGTESSNSGSSLKPAISSLTKDKEMSNQELSITSSHNELPDLGSNALAESSSMFPRIKEVTQSSSLSGQEKINYSHANNLPVENHIVTSNIGNSSLNLLQNKNQLLPISNSSFHQQQDNVSQLVHTQVSHTTPKSSEPIDPFCSNSCRQDALVYSQNNDLMVYSKPNEPFSNRLTYEMPGSLLGDKGSSLGYPNVVNKSVGLHSEKLPSSNAVPTMPINPAMSSSANMYSAYCSTNFYPTTTVTYSQNNFTAKSVNKSTGTLTDNISKKITPYSGFCDTTPSMSVTNKHFCSENTFHQNSLAKPNWEKTNNNKAYYNTLSNNLPDNNNDKDKNSSFQYDKIAGLEKPNETQINGQMTYLGFQNETVTSNAGGFLQNLSSTASVLQTSCSFNNIPSGHGLHNSTAPFKPINQHENTSNFNAALIGRNLMEKSFSSQPTNIDKGRPVSNIDEGTRNTSSCLPSFQPPERMAFAASCPESLRGVQNNNSFDMSSLAKTKKTTDNNCSSRINFTTEQKTLVVESQKAVTSSSNTVQVNSGHNLYNPISTAPFIEPNSKINAPSSNNINVDARRKVNEVQISYSQDKDVSKTNRFNENVSCKPSESAKTISLFSANVMGKENVSQTTSNVSPATLKTMNVDSERNLETNVYNNYVPKPSANGKNIQSSNAEINNTTRKMNDSVGNIPTLYKGYIGDANNSVKQLQDNHKPMTSSQKSVSTEMNPDEFQTFNYNSSSTYQKLLQTPNSSFALSSSKMSGTSVRTGSFVNYDNVNFGSLSNQYSNNSNRNASVCSNQNTNLPLQLLPPTSGSSQVISHPNNKTAMVSVMSHSLAQKETFNPKICPPQTDGSGFKGDMNIDYLKSKDMERNTFIPIIDDVRLTSDFSSDLFSSLQVPTGGQHSESISPTAAFLLAFPLVSTSRNIENLADNENHDNQTSTPTTILQIGNIEPPNTELFHSIEFQKNNKVNGHYEMNNDFIHVSDIHAKQNTSYNKTCEKKDVFPDFNKDQRAVEPKSKSKSSSAATISYSTQSYNYSHFSCNDYQQYCEKEGPQWQQEFSTISKDQKKSCEKKKDKGVQKGRIFQNYQEYYNYKDSKRKQQNRISVNWMTTPENKEQAEPYQPKDPEITNSYTGHSSQPVFNSIPIDFPTESFSDFCNAKKPNNYSWSPSKTLLPALDSHLMIPSTLPTLVGDLALGTSTPSESYKPFEPPKVQSAQGLIAKKPSEKNEENKNRTDFPKTQVNFSSVSELVDPKSKKQKTTDRSYRRQEKSSKQRGNFNCLKRKDDQCMYYEERNNYVLNQNQNQCIEKRHAYKGGSYSAESLIGAQQSEVDFSTNISYQQNPNYFQSDFSTHIDSGQQYGYFQQSHFSGFSHEEYQDFGFSTNQRNLDQTRPKVTVRKDDNYEGSGLQTQVYPPYSKITHYNLPSSQINTNTTTTLTNFNLSTIFPEMNDQRVASSGQTSQQMNTSFPSSQTYRSHLQQ